MKQKTQTAKIIAEHRPQTGAKIIPFPGVSLSDNRRTQDEAPDRFQNEIDEFLCEMGYIE